MLETGDGIFLRVSSVQTFAENVSWERGETIRTEEDRREFRELVFLRLYALLVSHILREG